MKRKIDEYYELDPSERKLALLNLLSAVMEVLARNNLTFYAYYGTLLGAVRHQGFIPWDDDVDLAMPRADYDRLKDIDWSRSGLLLISPQTMKHCPYPFAKVSDSNFHLVEEIDHPRITLGLNVDIFPIDVVNMSSLRIRQRIIFLINNIISAKVTINLLILRNAHFHFRPLTKKNHQSGDFASHLRKITRAMCASSLLYLAYPNPSTKY